MPRNGSGIYTLPPVYLAQPGTNILSVQHNTPLEDVASAVTNSVAADGQTPMRGNLRMGGNRVTGLADGVDASDAATVGQTVRNEGWNAALVNVEMVANTIPMATGPYTATAVVTASYGRSLLNTADAPAARTALGFTLNSFALERLNESQSFGLPIWTAGTETRPGIPTPAQVRASATAVTDAKAIGVGQTWQDVLPSRSLGVVYTNATGRPIDVSVTVISSKLEVSVDGSAWVIVGTGGADSNPRPCSITTTIPASHRYRVTSNSGGASISVWSELR